MKEELNSIKTNVKNMFKENIINHTELNYYMRYIVEMFYLIYNFLGFDSFLQEQFTYFRNLIQPSIELLISIGCFYKLIIG